MTTHINVDNIDYIKIRPRTKTSYVWQPIRPRKRSLFFNVPEIEAGWATNINNYRSSVRELLSRDYIYVGEVLDHPSGSWDRRACVTVRTKYEEHDRYFDTDLEANEWVNELIGMTNNEFAYFIDNGN